jgi:hypothetical protein
MPDLEAVKSLLLCALALAYALLMFWFGVFVLWHDAVYRLHTRWFRLSVEAFDAISYAGMAAWKIGAVLLFAIPWLALACVG